MNHIGRKLSKSSASKKGKKPSQGKSTLMLKLVLLGDPACGKTSLARRWSTDTFDPVYIPTRGLDVYRYESSFRPPSASPDKKSRKKHAAPPPRPDDYHRHGEDGCDDDESDGAAEDSHEKNLVRIVFDVWDVTLSNRATTTTTRLKALLRDADAICFCYDVGHVGTFANLAEWMTVVKESYAPIPLRHNGKISLHPIIPPDQPNYGAPTHTKTSSLPATPFTAAASSSSSSSAGSPAAATVSKKNKNVQSVGMTIEEHLPYMVLVGCKHDGGGSNHRRPVKIEQHKAFAAENDVAAYLTCARTGEGLKRLVADLGRELTGITVDEAAASKRRQSVFRNGLLQTAPVAVVVGNGTGGAGSGSVYT